MTDGQYKAATQAIDKVGEPKLRAIIEQINKHLEKHGVQVGVELKWAIQEIPKNETEADVVAVTPRKS